MNSENTLNIFEPHPYKHQLQYYGIRQYDIARSIGVSQGAISKMLSGISPMQERVEDEIKVILDQLKKKWKRK